MDHVHCVINHHALKSYNHKQVNNIKTVLMNIHEMIQIFYNALCIHYNTLRINVINTGFVMCLMHLKN